MKKIMILLGTRPEIIKLSPVLPELKNACELVVVHTGQHYSENLNTIIFEELELDAPQYNLQVGSKPPLEQLSLMLTRLEPILLKEKPDYLLVQGDTNSSLVATLAATRHHIPLIHIESGYRSGNTRMPEEVNRIITDRFSQVLLVGTQEGMEHLKREGVAIEKCHLVGNTATDALLRSKNLIKEGRISQYGVKKEAYVLVTLHRAENTATKEVLGEILKAINEVAKEIQIVFCIHPRTQHKIKEWNLSLGENIKILGATGYLDFIDLMQNSLFIMTDSGGVQEESVELEKACVVLRNETEFNELLKAGKLTLSTTNKHKIIELAQKYLKKEERDKVTHLPWTSTKGATRKIITVLKEENIL